MMLLAATTQTSTVTSWWAPVLGVAGVLGAAVIAGVFVWAQTRRDRRRGLYSDAYKTAMGWVEMLYRVRRRCEGQERELIERFHDIQEQISYYEGWLSTESPALGQSYCRLVAAVREATSPLIQEAWKQPVRPIAEHTRADDTHPDVKAARDAFLLDAREHLSPWVWVRWRVERRNLEPEHATATLRLARCALAPLTKARHPGRGAVSQSDAGTAPVDAQEEGTTGGA